MIDFIVVSTTLYFFYKGYFCLLNYIKKEEDKYNKMLRRSEDEHDATDWRI